ncbi:MAG: YggS family pyridoxal phosphate-dependent enzyme [Gammaproteobacteria bacterium]
MQKKLNAARPISKGPLNVCLQLNIDYEKTKSGLNDIELEEFLDQTKNLENIKIRGLMVIPKPRESLEEQKKVFRAVKEIYLSLNNKGSNFDSLSMGMTSDYAAAIQEGATMVRIGTGIFGPRK